MKPLSNFYLKRLCSSDVAIATIFYQWSLLEMHNSYYTCRPLKEKENFTSYIESYKTHIHKGVIYYALFNRNNPDQVLAKISMFDYNPRNRSVEFGYYMPEFNRGKGFGKIMIHLFLIESFENTELNLNKLYATTSSNNIPSCHLLEAYNFTLDGRLRNHFLIDDSWYDQMHYSILKTDLISKA